MKFIELKKHIQSNDFYAVYNLFGDDAFLIDLAENLFVKYVIENVELNKTVLSTENFDAKNLQNIMNTSTFLGGRKLVLLRVVDEQKIGDLANEISNYAKSVNPNAILIISSKNALFDAKKQENFTKNGKFFSDVDCSRLDVSMTMAWMNSALKEKNASMTLDAKNLLFAYTNGYLSRISTELDKLVSFANGREIERADVELLVSKELEFSVFEWKQRKDI